MYKFITGGGATCSETNGIEGVVITTPSEDSNICSEAVILTRVDSYCLIIPLE